LATTQSNNNINIGQIHNIHAIFMYIAQVMVGKQRVKSCEIQIDKWVVHTSVRSDNGGYGVKNRAATRALQNRGGT